MSYETCFDTSVYIWNEIIIIVDAFWGFGSIAILFGPLFLFLFRYFTYQHNIFIEYNRPLKQSYNIKLTKSW